jgi:hypothetical protein
MDVTFPKKALNDVEKMIKNINEQSLEGDLDTVTINYDIN